MDDFQIQEYVSWYQIELLFGKRRYNKFKKWMYGQTTDINGVYPYDLERYLDMVNNGTPTSFD